MDPVAFSSRQTDSLSKSPPLFWFHFCWTSTHHILPSMLSFSMFNKPAKFEKQLSRGAMSISNDVNHPSSPTTTISKSVVEEVHASIDDAEYRKVRIWKAFRWKLSKLPTTSIPLLFSKQFGVLSLIAKRISKIDLACYNLCF